MIRTFGEIGTWKEIKLGTWKETKILTFLIKPRAFEISLIVNLRLIS